ncbi:MAG: PKD domain-containing protein, partial [Saprospiraceae bacterium]|nr:PKD domain-containing protein [Saprospiraceae bacterium]
FFLIICLPLSILHTQNHDFNWQYGDYYSLDPSNYNHFAIDFNEEPPATYPVDRELNMNKTMVSVCDSIGNLLFYTNGIQIANFEHQIMENGDSLNPGDYANQWYEEGYFLVQSEVILPMSGHAGLYYLFHLRIDHNNIVGLYRNTLFYSKVDMNANNGDGKVVEKNQVMLDLTDVGRFGLLTAVKHANGRDWWIFVPEHGKNIYYYFLFTPNGLEGPYEVSMEPVFDVYTLGALVFSPDGKKMGRFETEHGLYFYDFDRCDAALSNPVFIPLPNTSLGGGLAFSPNSRFAYIAATNSVVLQFDLWADDVAASLDTVAVYDGYMSPVWTTFYRMQNGPDGRIYINCTNTTDVLHYIDQPNKKGETCRVMQHGLQLPFRNSYTIPHFPNYRLGPLDGSPCDTLGLDNHPVAKYRCYQDTSDYLTVEFTDLSTYAPTAWAWDFGDGTESQDTSPVHTFPGGGTYEVCLTVSNQYSSDTFCKTLQLGPSATEGRPVPQADISVFPNPAQSFTNVRLGGDYLPRNARITLFAATGQPVHSQRLAAGWGVVPLEGLAPGIYFWEVKDDGRLMGSGKLVRVE